MTTNAVSDILNQLPLAQLADQFGVDEATIQQAAAAAIPSLIGGLTHNAQQPDEEQGIAGALLQHADSNLLSGGSIDLNNVDTADGQKIVHHIFGAQAPALSDALGASSATGSANKSLFDKLLPILAPIVLAYLAQQISGKIGAGGGGGGGGGILNDIINGARGQSTQAPQQRSGGGLSDILGGILGGGLGSILGSQAGQTSQVQQPVPQPHAPQNSPFNVPGSGSGDLQIDDSAPTTVDGRPLPSAGQSSAQADENPLGGILGDVLGGLFGKKR